MPAALGEGAVRTTFFYFHDGSADGFGKHRVMLFSSEDRKADGQIDRKMSVSKRRTDWPLMFTCNCIIFQILKNI